MSLRPTDVQAPRTGTSLLYTLIAKLKAYPDGISLGRGDPDFPTPAHILEAVKESLEDGGRELSVPARLDTDLREAIARRLRAINRIDVDPATEIVLTQGGQEALFLMVQAAVGPGDEIILPEPNYNTYADAIEFSGATCVPLITSMEDNFDIDPDRVRALITPKTRAIVLVSPNNPTAAVLSPERVRELAALAQEHDLIVLGDDIYDCFLYDGAVQTSFASLPGMKGRTLTLNALSKTYSMTGWRVGWVAGPAPLMQQLRHIKEAVSGGLSALAMRAGIAALTGPQEPVAEMLAAYKRRRRIMMDGVSGMGFRYGVPQGGQFMLVDITPTGLGSVDLANRVLEEAHIVIYPGVSFGESWDGHVRMTFLQPEERLAEALRRMGDVVRRLGR